MTDSKFYKLAKHIKKLTFTETWQLARYLADATGDQITQLEEGEQIGAPYFAHLINGWAEEVINSKDKAND